jgi:hypothetical protein
MGIAVWLIIIGVFIFLFIRNKNRSLNAYTAYYKSKRQQFTWLDKWINDNIDPSPLRAESDSIWKNILSSVLFLAIVIIGSLFFRSLIGQIIVIVLGFLAAFFIGRKKAIDPAYLPTEAGLTLECPSCGCPHSWVMLNKENIVEGYEKTTKSTTKIREDGAGSDWGFGRGTVSSTKKEVTVVCSGKSIKDFKCLNCGKTEHNVYEMEWTNKVPDTGLQKFDPPKPAWDPTDAIKAKARRAEIKQEKEEQQQEKEKQRQSEIESKQWYDDNKGQVDNYAELEKQAELFIKKKDYSNAVSLYTEMLSKCPDYTSNIKFLRAEAFLNNGMYDEAIKDCDDLMSGELITYKYGKYADKLQKIRATALKKKS